MKRIVLAIALLCVSAALAAPAQTTYQANLSCTAPTLAAGQTLVGFPVYRAVHGSSAYALLTGSAPPTACAYSDATVASGTSYDYYVETAATISGVAGTVYSAPSSVLTLAIPAPVPAPGAPTGTVVQQTVTTATNTKAGTTTTTVTTKISPPVESK